MKQLRHISGLILVGMVMLVAASLYAQVDTHEKATFAVR